MALPSLSATWRFRVNETISSAGTVESDNAQLFINIIDAMLGGGSWTDSSGASAAVSNPWTVIESNGRLTGPSASNVLTSIAEVDWSTSGNRFWIILENAAGVQVLLASPNNNTFHNLYVAFSIGGLFTGGTSTTLPTASDQVVWSTNGGVFSNTSGVRILHVLHSTDGLSTYITVNMAGACISTIHFSNIMNPKSLITNPFYLGIAAAGASASNHPITGAGGFLNGTSSNINMNYSSLSAQLSYTTVGNSAGVLPSALTAINEFDNEYPIYPLGIAGYTTGARGHAGMVRDVWVGNWTPLGANGAQYPDTGTIRQFAQNGYLIYPWNQSLLIVS